MKARSKKLVTHLEGLLPIFIVFAGVLGVISVIAFIGVIVSEDAACFVSKLLGTGIESKENTLKFLGWIISGVIAFFGLLAINRRADVQDEANKLTEKGHALERFKVAVDQLSKKDSPLSHIASFHALFYLAKTRRKSYAQGTLDVLCVHLKQITKYEDFADLHSVYEHPEEVKILTRILFGQETGKVFDRLHFDLRHANLSGIDFRGIKNPKEVDFSLAYLNKAVFNNANLSGANFNDATLFESEFVKINFQEAYLRKADFLCADLIEVDFSNARMEGTLLFGAKCPLSDFHEAILIGADFRHADLHEAKNLETALLWNAKYNDETHFPDGFDPKKASMEYCPPDK